MKITRIESLHADAGWSEYNESPDGPFSVGKKPGER
jgi:hypothetical protein